MHTILHPSGRALNWRVIPDGCPKSQRDAEVLRIQEHYVTSPMHKHARWLAGLLVLMAISMAGLWIVFPAYTSMTWRKVVSLKVFSNPGLNQRKTQASAHSSARSESFSERRRKNGTDAWHKSSSSQDVELHNFEELAKILKRKLSQFPTEKPFFAARPCAKAKSRDSPCLNDTCPYKFSPLPRDRLKQILATVNHTLQPYLDMMAEATRRVPTGRRYVLVSAVSSNHYGEMQAMVRNVHQYLLPRLANFTFVMFDLGLTPQQRNLTERNCKCVVLDFPFKSFPAYFSHLKCYTWKPTIIRSLIDKAKFLVWMDASVRWSPNVQINSTFKRCEERGLQLGMSKSGNLGYRTDTDTFRFYRDHWCQYQRFGEIWATYGLYHNEPFVRQAVLDPWLSCAFSQQCMCVANHKKLMGCRLTNPPKIPQCHRFDQSSLGIILSKLYGTRNSLVRMPRGIKTGRGDTSDWFKPDQKT